MKCIQCNTPIAENARFCPKCGLPIAAMASETPTMNEKTISVKEAEKEALTRQEERTEQSMEQEEHIATSTASKNENATSVDVSSRPSEPLVASKEGITAPDIAELAALEEETPSALSTEETIEIVPLARAVAEAALIEHQQKAQEGLSPVDAVSTVPTSPLPPEPANRSAPAQTARGETPRIPGRPRTTAGAKSSAHVPPRATPAAPIPPRPNGGQAPVPASSSAPAASAPPIPSRPRQTSARFLTGAQNQQNEQGEQKKQEVQDRQDESHHPLSAVEQVNAPVAPVSLTAPVLSGPQDQALDLLPTMPMEAMPPVPQTAQMPPTPYTPQGPEEAPLSPLPPIPAPLIPPDMPIPPERYFQAQPLSSQKRPGVISMQPTKRSRTRRGCLPGFLITLVLIVILGVAGWTFVARPYLHNQAMAQLDQAMTAEVNQLPTFLPVPGGAVRVTDAMLTNLLALSLPSNVPIQNAQVQISKNGLQISFQTEGFSSTITGVPVASQGHLLFSQVAVKGIVSLILSANDIASLCNQHLAVALTRIHHTVSRVILLDHAMDVVLA